MRKIEEGVQKRKVGGYFTFSYDSLEMVKNAN